MDQINGLVMLSGDWCLHEERRGLQLANADCLLRVLLLQVDLLLLLLLPVLPLGQLLLLLEWLLLLR